MKPKTTSVKIVTDPIDGSPKLFVAGQDISASVRSVSLHVDAGRMPTCEVHLSNREAVADLPEAVVKVVSWRSPLETRYRELLDRAQRALSQEGAIMTTQRLELAAEILTVSRFGFNAWSSTGPYIMPRRVR